MDKATLLSAASLKTKTVTLAGIGDVTVQELTEAQAVKYMHLRQGTDDESVIYLLTNSVLDDTGEKMFATTDKAAIQGLVHPSPVLLWLPQWRCRA